MPKYYIIFIYPYIYPCLRMETDNNAFYFMFCYVKLGKNGIFLQSLVMCSIGILWLRLLWISFSIVSYLNNNN